MLSLFIKQVLQSSQCLKNFTFRYFLLLRNCLKFSKIIIIIKIFLEIKSMTKNIVHGILFSFIILNSVICQIYRRMEQVDKHHILNQIINKKFQSRAKSDKIAGLNLQISYQRAQKHQNRIQNGEDVPNDVRVELSPQKKQELENLKVQKISRYLQQSLPSQNFDKKKVLDQFQSQILYGKKENNQKIRQIFQKIDQQNSKTTKIQFTRSESSHQIKAQTFSSSTKRFSQYMPHKSKISVDPFSHGISDQQLKFSQKLIQLKNQPISMDSQLAQEEKQYYQNKYNISQYPEQPICVMVPSYNNQQGDRYLHNIRSILQQDYSNYRVIFFDDASEDNTWALINKFKSEERISDEKLKLVRNERREMAMGNIYKAANLFCEPYEIFIIVDGDDELVGRQVFKHFNALFQGENLWLAYSNFINAASKYVGYSRPFDQNIIATNSFRKVGFVISHLRAFYTKLFRLIKQDDLKDQDGKWLKAANDVAIMYPILEMAQQKHKYLPQISYLYNPNTGLNNHHTKAQEQVSNARRIKQEPAYQALKELFDEKQKLMLSNNTNLKIPLRTQEYMLQHSSR